MRSTPTKKYMIINFPYKLLAKTTAKIVVIFLINHGNMKIHITVH